MNEQPDQKMSPALAFRRAEAADAAFLADMINLSNAGADTDRQQAIANVLSEGSDVGHANAIIADVDGRRVAAMVLNHPSTLPADPDTCLPEHRPYVRLRAKAANSLYLRNIATIPEMRGRGLGSALLNLAKAIASQSNANGICAIVHAGNLPMHATLERAGFLLIAHDRLDSHPTLGPDVEIGLWAGPAIS
ncbi:MAG: GNAT family N-acetyltransferase [Nitratireductor sp.]|nr:GNAT family N-acetyltransferase [Nitratireductor sp.]